MRLVWSGEARQDRRSSLRYIAPENPRAALALDETFSAKARVLIAHREIGRLGRVAGTREFLVHKRYLLIYQIGEGVISILRVLHISQLWPPSDDRA